MTQQQIEATLTMLQSKSCSSAKAHGWAIRLGLALLKERTEKKKWQRLAQSRGETLQQITALATHEMKEKEDI